VQTSGNFPPAMAWPFNSIGLLVCIVHSDKTPASATRTQAGTWRYCVIANDA
jgi:hypothetical protein